MNGTLLAGVGLSPKRYARQIIRFNGAKSEPRLGEPMNGRPSQREQYKVSIPAYLFCCFQALNVLLLVKFALVKALALLPPPFLKVLAAAKCM